MNNWSSIQPLSLLNAKLYNVQSIALLSWLYPVHVSRLGSPFVLFLAVAINIEPALIGSSIVYVDGVMITDHVM